MSKRNFQDKDFSVYSQDGGKIIQNYDQAMEDYLTIPISLSEGWEQLDREDMERMEVADIKEECTRRGRDVSDINDREVLSRILLNTQRVPIAFSGPEMSFSDPRLVTGKRSKGKSDVTIHYPLIALNRTDIRPDDRRDQNSTDRKVGYASQGDQILVSSLPMPVIFSYEIVLMSLYRQEMNAMDFSVLRGFGIRDTIFIVDLGMPWGKKKIFVSFDSGYRDESELEGRTRDVRRRIRHIYTAEVKGWLPNEARMKRTVRRIVTRYEDHNSRTGSSDILSEDSFPEDGVTWKEEEGGYDDR